MLIGRVVPWNFRPPSPKVWPNQAYIHANNVFKTFKLNNLGDYHDLYIQSDTLLLADVFGNFRKACIKTYELDPAHFISLPGLAWQACLKKNRSEIRVINRL